MTSDQVLVQDHLLFPEILWKMPQNIYKRKRGKVLVLDSPLTLEAAFATGASLVLLGFPENLEETFQKILPENMLYALPETPAGSLSLAAESKILDLTKEMDAVVLGEGLSRNNETGQLIQKIVPQIPAILILEKDALFHISPSLFLERKSPTIILSDTSEIAALLHKENFQTPDRRPIMEHLYKHREEIARQTAKQWQTRLPTSGSGGQVILILKGEQTILTDGEKIIINLLGGKNEFLAGILAALVSQNKEQLLEAAATAIYLQSKAKGLKDLPEIISQ